MEHLTKEQKRHGFMSYDEVEDRFDRQEKINVAQRKMILALKPKPVRQRILAFAGVAAVLVVLFFGILVIRDPSNHIIVSDSAELDF